MTIYKTHTDYISKPDIQIGDCLHDITRSLSIVLSIKVLNGFNNCYALITTTRNEVFIIKYYRKFGHYRIEYCIDRFFANGGCIC